MRNHKRRPGRLKARLVSFLLLVAAGSMLISYIRPLPQASAAMMPINSSVLDVKLDWPAQGSAAIGAQGFGVLAAHGDTTARPTASIAKLITVLAVLEKHPLKPGDRGPTITLGQADVDLYTHYFNEGGSYVKVEKGEKITLYQALEAILLPSANNMADSMAIWSFGSMDKYLTYANGMLKRLGLSHTVAATDASGFSPNTVSTSSDLVALGEQALDNPIIAQIVALPSAVIPVHGIIYSANSRLGLKSVMGIKTGLTDQAGGCFVFAQKATIDGRQVMLIGAIMGEPSLLNAMEAAGPLLTSAHPYFSLSTPIKAGEPFATLTTPWMASAQVVAQTDVTLIAWRGKTLTPRIELSHIGRSLPAGTQVGTALIASGNNVAKTPLVLGQAISGPSWAWRVKRL